MSTVNVYEHLRQEVARAVDRNEPHIVNSPQAHIDRAVGHFNTALDAGIRDLQSLRYEVDQLLHRLASNDDGVAWTALTSLVTQAGASGTLSAIVSSAYRHLTRAHTFAQAAI